MQQGNNFFGNWYTVYVKKSDEEAFFDAVKYRFLLVKSNINLFLVLPPVFPLQFNFSSILFSLLFSFLFWHDVTIVTKNRLPDNCFRKYL